MSRGVAYRDSGVTYLRWDVDDVVSESHHLVLEECARRGVPVRSNMNDGRRTMALQWERYRNQPPLAAYPSPTAPHILRGREDHAIDFNSWMVGQVMAVYRALGIRCGLTVPGECVPLDTEILTRRGFKAPTQLVAGDETLGFDAAIGCTRWTRIIGWRSFDDREVLRHEHAQILLDATAEHRWVTQRHNTAPLTMASLGRSAESQGARILLAAPARVTGRELDITPEEAGLLGWALTDGSIYRFENSRGKRAFARVYQSKAVGIAAVEQVMTGFPHTRDDDFVKTRSPNSAPCVRWYVGRETFSPILERSRLDDLGPVQFVLLLNDAQRSAFLGAVRMAEGQQHGGMRRIAQNSRQDAARREAFAIAAAMDGYLVSDRPTSREVGLKRPWVYPCNLVTRSLGPQTVWCPTTELGTWTARQNDHILLTGNSWHMGLTGGEAELLRAAARLGDPLRAYPADERRWIREHDELVRRERKTSRSSPLRRRRIRVLRRVMVAKRKSIWRAAQDTGWEALNRRARYRSLLARTT